MSDVQNHNPISLLVVSQIDQNLILRGGDVTVMTAALSDGFKNPDHFTAIANSYSNYFIHYCV